LFIAKKGIPSSLLNRIRRLAAFQNPEFYRRQSMRLSTATTPRVIACAEDLPEHVALPRGCLVELEQLLHANGVALEVTDGRVAGQPLPIEFQGKLTQTQRDAAQALLPHDTGVFVAPPGSGKTVVAAYLVAARACSTLIIVHRKQLLDQWLTQLTLFLRVGPESIGQIHGTRRAPTGRIDIAMFQSLVRRDRVADLVADYGQVIVDECHHVPAVQFERVLREAKARYILGLTATPHRRDGHHPISEMQLGPVRHRISPKAQALSRTFAHRLIVRETTFRSGLVDEHMPIQSLYAALARDEERNALILSDIVYALQEGRSPIVLTERKDHLEHLARRLARTARHIIVLQGGTGPRVDRAIRAQLDAVPAHEERVILATGRYAGEGFDDARLDTLFLALPVSWKGTLIQYAGRIHRLHPEKLEVRIFDYVDQEVPALVRMFEKRLRGYRSIGYVRNETPPEYAENLSELVTDPVDDVLHVFDHESAADRTSDFSE
jgi:superfamily II DNA or RNA helicase